jgi:Cu2+-exporting ATPase
VTEHPGEGLSAHLLGGEARLGSRRFCGSLAGSDDDSPELWLSLPGQSPRRFAFSDTLRPDAAAVIRALKHAGKRVMLLSGDRPAVVSALAASLGIADWLAGLTPDQKYIVLEERAARGEKILMVGDGLNDAPALAAAHVSMSPASGADVSQAAADIVFQGQSLAAVTETLDAARQSARIVRENIGFAIAYNAVAVPLAMAGYVTPLLAAVAMSTSSIIVVVNALRLYRSRA